MKIEINSKKVFINSGNNKEEIHPFWLRERINNEDALDKGNQQRLFDPNSINTNIDIEKIENEQITFKVGKTRIIKDVGT